MEPTNLQKAIVIATKASKEDQDGKYEDAIKSYQHAVKIFLHVIKREPQGKDGNQKIRDKCTQYLDRVEELQEHLNEKQEKRDLFQSDMGRVGKKCDLVTCH